MIVNAVILLFVNDVDEQVFNIVRICNRGWLGKLQDESEAYSSTLLESDVSDDADFFKVSTSRKSPTNLSVSTALENPNTSLVSKSSKRASVAVNDGTTEELIEQMRLLREQVHELQKWRANEEAVMGILGGGGIKYKSTKVTND